MKLAISNIAWQQSEEIAVAELLQKYGIRGVEIAPTKIWRSPLDVTPDEIKAYRRLWSNYHVEIVSMQALLFGRPELTIFESDEKRMATLEYLSKIIRFAGELGVTRLVFGSPKNRKVGDLNNTRIEDIAVSFFGNLGKIAKENNCIFCIEPNPTDYGCDFVTNSGDGSSLVRNVDHPGFGLHLDAAGMTLSNENIERSLQSAFDVLRHFHISEPFLEPVTGDAVDHDCFASALQKFGYDQWVSIEMKTRQTGSNLSGVEAALKLARQKYLS